MIDWPCWLGRWLLVCQSHTAGEDQEGREKQYEGEVLPTTDEMSDIIWQFKEDKVESHGDHEREREKERERDLQNTSTCTTDSLCSNAGDKHIIIIYIVNQQAFVLDSISEDQLVLSPQSWSSRVDPFLDLLGPRMALRAGWMKHAYKRKQDRVILN